MVTLNSLKLSAELSIAYRSSIKKGYDKSSPWLLLDRLSAVLQLVCNSVSEYSHGLSPLWVRTVWYHTFLYICGIIQFGSKAGFAAVGALCLSCLPGLGQFKGGLGNHSHLFKKNTYVQCRHFQIYTYWNTEILMYVLFFNIFNIIHKLDSLYMYRAWSYNSTWLIWSPGSDQHPLYFNCRVK